MVLTSQTLPNAELCVLEGITVADWELVNMILFPSELRQVDCQNCKCKAYTLKTQGCFNPKFGSNI